ncbi:hypothetical protein OROMI_024534 [Orobanche minor]
MPSQKILKIRDGTPLKAEGILTYRKSPRNCSVWHFSSKLDVPSNVVQKKRVARILVFKIRSSQEILKIRDGTPLEAEEILTYRKALDTARFVARILVFKIRPSKEILKIRDGTPLEAEGILTYRKSPRNYSVWHFFSKLYVPSNVVQKKEWHGFWFSKLGHLKKFLKFVMVPPFEGGRNFLTYRKSPRNCSIWHFSSKLYVPSNIVQKERVARILVFKIRPSQKILKIRDGTPLKAEGILTYRKSPRNCSVWHFSSKLDVPSNVVQKKRVARILVFKIRSSQEILKIRDGTPLEAEGILTYKKKPPKLLEPSQKILKIRDGTPLKAEGILTYRKSPRNCSVWHFSSKLDVPSNVVQKKRVARILVFKIRSSQEILKIRDGTPLEAEEILTYRKALDTARFGTFLMSSQEILKIRDESSQEILKIRDEILKIRDGTPLEAISKILKIRDGTPLEAEGILTYRKSPQNCSVWHFSSKLDVPSNVVQKERVARILVFKIRPSKEILKSRDGTPLKAEGILTYRKSPRNCSVWHFSSKLDVPSNVVKKKRVARILVFKIRPSQEILKIRDGTPLEKKRVERIMVFKIRPSKEILKIGDGTPLEAEEILTYRKSPRYCSVWHFSSKPSQNVLKICDGTPLEAGGILTYRKGHRNCSVLHFSSKLDVPSNIVQKKRVARILLFKIRPSQEILKIRDVQNKRVARILVFKIRSSQEILKIRDGTPLEAISKILKIRDGTPLEAEGILTYRKSPRNCSVWHFSSKLDVPSNVVQKERVARILVFKIRPSKEILKSRDGTPLKAEGILTYRKSPRNCSVWHFSSKLDVPSNVVKKKRVARILVFKIRPSQEILKIRDGTPLEKRVERIMVFKIRPSKEILKIGDGTPLEAEEILTYRKSPRYCSVWHFSSKPSQNVLKICDGTPLEAGGILTYRKGHRNCSVLHFSSKLDVPSNIVQKKRVARILLFKIRPSQEILKIRDEPSQKILKIRDGTPLKAEGILTYRKSPRNCSVWHFSSKLDVPSNVVQKKRVARILVFKIRSSQEILKIRDGTPLEAEEILTYRKALDTARFGTFLVKILKIRDGTPLEAEGILTYRKSPRNYSLYVPSNIVQKERVARILVFKIRPSQKILKIRDGTPLKAEGILTYRKSPRNCSVWHFSSKLDVPSNVVQKKRVARILVFKIRSSQEILKIRDGTPLEAEEILKIRDESSQEILKIRDGTPLEMSSQEILKIRDVARILVFKIRPSQKILKIRDGTPLKAEGILTYRKSPRNCSVWHFSSKLDVPSNVVQKKRVARILVFKIRSSQEILKIRDGTPLEAEEILTYRKALDTARFGTFLAEGILTYRKSPRNYSLDVPSNVVQKKRVARILVFKIRSSQKILKIRDGTPLKAEGILTYRKRPRNCSVWHFSSKLDVPSNVVQKKRVARILVFKIRSSQEILKIRDGTPLEAEEILTYRKALDTARFEPSQKILKIRDGTPLKAEGILTYRKSPRNCSVWHFSSKLDVPSNVVQKKRVARILVFKIRSSQEILKIRDGTPLEAEGILTYRKRPSKLLESSQEILKIRDGTPLEAEGILTYRKSPRNCSVWHFSSKLDVPSNVVQKKRVARILVFKIRPSKEILKIRDGTPSEMSSQEILKIRDGTPLECTEKIVARILVFKIRPSQKILKIRDGTPLEAEGILTYRKSPRNCSVWHFSSKLDVPSNVVQKERVPRILVFKIRPSKEILKSRDGTPLKAEGILTYRKSPRNCSVWHFSSKLDVPSNVVQKKRVAQILVFKIRPSQEILKIRDGTPLEKKRVERIMVFKIRPSKEILKIGDGTPLEAEEILTYRKSPRYCSVWHFSSKLDVPSYVVQKKRVAQILLFKIRSSQEILKIRDGTPFEMPSKEILKIRDCTPLEAEGILTYRKSPRYFSVWHFSNVPSNVVQKKRVAQILLFKIRPSQEILKIPDGTPLEAEGTLTYRKKPPKLLVQKKRVERIMVFKIRPSEEILKIGDGTPLEMPSQNVLKICDGTPLEAGGILTYRKGHRNCSVLHFSSKLDVPSNVVQKKRVARILLFKIRPSQEILKIRDGTPLEAEGTLTYRKKPPKLLGILVFKIRPSQEILKIRDGTPLEAEGILTYRKSPRNCSVWHFSRKPSQNVLKICDGTPLEAEGILTYRKGHRNCSVLHFSSKLDVPSNVGQKKRVARILLFKIRPSQEILKIRDGTPLEAEGILTYKKKPPKLLEKLDVPSNVGQKERVAWILVFKIRPSQKILKIRDGTLLKAEGILTYRKSPRNCSVWHFSSKLDVPSNVVQKKRVERIMVFKIRPSKEILKIRDGTPLEAEEILTYRKSPRYCSVWHFSSKLDVPSNVVQKKELHGFWFCKIRPSQNVLKICDGTPLEAGGILTYRKGHRNCSVLHFSSKLDVSSNIVQKKRVARILLFKIRPSQEILKIRDGTPLEEEGILTYKKKPPKLLGFALF